MRDLRGNMMVHPTRSERVGKNIFNEQDPAGKYYVREFIEAAKPGGDHIPYKFRPSQTNQWVDKTSYVTDYQRDD